MTVGSGSPCPLLGADEPCAEEASTAEAASAVEDACTADGASTSAAKASALTVAAVRTDSLPFPRGSVGTIVE
ncbi:hypothetical protein GCM10018955_15170 [Planomonospora venezuelensis]